MKEALCHPTADELDDYKDYERAMFATANEENNIDRTIRDQAERHMSSDSGYLSLKRLKQYDSEKSLA